MLNEKIFIDSDGVIVDSEDRVIERREKDNDISWDEFFEKIDWFQLLDESLIINDAINCILEGQKKRKRYIYFDQNTYFNGNASES